MIRSVYDLRTKRGDTSWLWLSLLALSSRFSSTKISGLFTKWTMKKTIRFIVLVLDLTSNFHFSVIRNLAYW